MFITKKQQLEKTMIYLRLESAVNTLVKETYQKLLIFYQHIFMENKMKNFLTVFVLGFMMCLMVGLAFKAMLPTLEYSTILGVAVGVGLTNGALLSLR